MNLIIVTPGEEALNTLGPRRGGSTSISRLKRITILPGEAGHIPVDDESVTRRSVYV